MAAGRSARVFTDFRVIILAVLSISVQMKLRDAHLRRTKWPVLTKAGTDCNALDTSATCGRMPLRAYSSVTTVNTSHMWWDHRDNGSRLQYRIDHLPLFGAAAERLERLLDLLNHDGQ